MNAQSNQVKLEVYTDEKPAFTVVGMMARVTPGDPKIMKLWMDFEGQVERVRGQTNRGVFYGAMHNYDMATNEFDYVAAVEVEAGQEAPEGMVAWHIPAQTYAVFETTLPEIGPAFEHIYQTWLLGSDFERTDGPEFEYYDSDFDPNVPSSPVKIYVPVKSK